MLYSELKTEVLSYFSLSKIHGRPFGPWNNVDPPLNPQGQPKGFCVHHEIQFLTWHRPYVALFEQEIYKRANSIAKEYKTDSEAWIQAASDLRQPYWNWADPSGILPQALLDLFFKDSVTIGPASKDGAESSVSNPFCLYHFKDGERDGFTTDPPPPVVDWPQTLRYPTSKGPEARSNMTKFNTMLNLEGDRIRYDTERLSSLTTWKAFSSDGGKTTNSLEKIHDDMHDLIGGIFDGGHMSRIPFAAFDPIFWLHHAQIDRLTDKWHNERQLWAPDADHKPFRNSDTSDTFWNSNQIQEPKSFNYEYKPAMQRQPGWGKEFGLVDEDTILEWSVRIRYKAFELGGNFSILLFFTEDESPIPEDPHDRYDLFLLPNYIGSFNTFINPESDECANCQEHANDIQYGFVHINKHILNKPYGGSLDPTRVVPLLTNRLTWRIFKGDATRVDPTTSFPSLIIDVIATPLTQNYPAFPHAEEPTVYEGITHGKPGGSRDSQ